MLYGAVDPGLEAAQTGTWWATAQQVDLSPRGEVVSIGGFTGFLPETEGRADAGYALLRWDGPDRTPIEQAIVTIPREVQVVYLLGTRNILRYLPGAPDFVSDLRVLHNGDFVAVYVR